MTICQNRQQKQQKQQKLVDNLSKPLHTTYMTMNNQKPVLITDIRTGEKTEHSTLTEAADHINKTPSAITKAIQRRSVISRTYTAEYTNTEQEQPTQEISASEDEITFDRYRGET